MAGKILVIRGGALGDFILTLPAIRLLREAFPDARLEILGYPHIAAVAEGRFYADAIRSIEYGPMAGFFHPRAALDDDLSGYFGQFNQVVSWLFDPDEIFAGNLRKSGVRNLIVGNGRLDDSRHAAHQLAHPLDALGLYLDDPAAEVFPSSADRERGRALVSGDVASTLALHPGSGSEKKNWPLESWIVLIVRLLAAGQPIAIITGEADRERAQVLQGRFGGQVQWVHSPPLPILAGLLAECGGYVGHDSGVSHLAAAAGARCVHLFGPTDPEVWGAQNRAVQILRASDQRMESIPVDHVLDGIEAW